MWMSELDYDTKSGDHVNFHAIKDGVERYNFHIKFAPPFGCIYRWYGENFTGSDLEITTNAIPEVDPPALTAPNAAEQLIWQIAALTGSNDIANGQTNLTLAATMTRLLVDLAQLAGF